MKPPAPSPQCQYQERSSWIVAMAARRRSTAWLSRSTSLSILQSRSHDQIRKWIIRGLSPGCRVWVGITVLLRLPRGEPLGISFMGVVSPSWLRRRCRFLPAKDEIEPRPTHCLIPPHHASGGSGFSYAISRALHHRACLVGWLPK